MYYVLCIQNTQMQLSGMARSANISSRRKTGGNVSIFLALLHTTNLIGFASD